MHAARPSVAWILAALMSPAGSALAAQETPSYEEVLERSEQLLKRNPLRYHIRAWEELAATKDPRAVGELAARYAKPQRPKAQVQYLIASSAAAKGGAEATVAAFDGWREAAHAPEDAWLWYQALSVRRTVAGPDELVRIARAEADPFLRGSAVEALAIGRERALYELVPALCATLPKEPELQCALVGALSTAVARTANKQSRVTNEWQGAALALVALLERDEVPRAAKLVIARHLAQALEAERVVLEAGAWRALLAGERAQAKGSAGEGRSVVRPRFFGIEATGERICYVIDLSDSMCEPLPEALKAKHRGPPVTGGGQEPPSEEAPADAIPWDVVNTRFDLAREHLRVSLGSLSEEQSFCVVAFGDKAELLEGAGGMTKASRANVKKALKALDGIEIGSPRGDRPHGTLWGGTNLHAGLRTAFQVRKKGLASEHEYVAPDTFLEGCDTIFLLSDGNPSCDDYGVQDTDYGDGWVGDPESGEEHERTKDLFYLGPYSNWPPLLEEVRRWNLFREVEIHCISVGDADPQNLARVAELGLGTVTKFDA